MIPLMTARQGFQNPGPLPRRPKNTRQKLEAFAGMALWFLFWSGYNTGPGLVLHPNFPTTNWELIHGVRAYFPLLAGWFALLWLLTPSKTTSRGAVEGPLGLMLVYSLIGVISSVLFSPDWFQASYWALAFGSVALVGIAILSTDYPVETASSLLTLSGIIAVAMTLGIMIGMPLIGGPSVTVDPLSLQAVSGGYKTAGFIGMSGTRNTGFARYAAVAGLYALGRLWQGRMILRSLWFMGLLFSGYCLIKAQGRSEIVAFIAGSLIILLLRRSRRVILVVWGIGLAALMWSAHFFDRFWDYGTRTGHFDPSFTGRTVTWHEGWRLFLHSPCIGFGFSADRYFLQGQHMHDALMHALVQTGLLGTVAFLLALVLAVVLMVKLYIAAQVRRSDLFRDEVPGLLVFFILLSVTESTAYFSADWLLLAPVLVYIQGLAWQQGVLKGRARSAYGSAVRMGRRALAFHSSEAAERN
jgi:O-antigen ligase